MVPQPHRCKFPGPLYLWRGVATTIAKSNFEGKRLVAALARGNVYGGLAEKLSKTKYINNYTYTTYRLFEVIILLLYR